MLLILSLPARLGHQRLALEQEAERLQSWEKRFALLAVPLIFLGDGWEDDLANGGVFGDVATEQIINVPACTDDQERAVGREPRDEVISKPVPGVISPGLAAGLGTTLDEVVEHAEVQFHAGDRAVDRCVAERSRAADVFDEVAVALPPRLVDPKRRKDVAIPLALEQPLQIEIAQHAEIVGIARINRFPIWMQPGDPGDEVFDPPGFSVLRRGHDRELGAFAGDECAVEFFQLACVLADKRRPQHARPHGATEHGKGFPGEGGIRRGDCLQQVTH
jgi:hypothetical protein